MKDNWDKHATRTHFSCPEGHELFYLEIWERLLDAPLFQVFNHVRKFVDGSLHRKMCIWGADQVEELFVLPTHMHDTQAHESQR